MTFTLGQPQHERIAVDVKSYERLISGEYYDDNWLVISIEVMAGGFSGRARASILTDELTGFSEQLHRLYRDLSGSAEFSTLEDQLSLKVIGNGRGHISLSGKVSDAAGVGNTLSFAFDFDQTMLQQAIREIDHVINAFPIRRVNAQSGPRD